MPLLLTPADLQPGMRLTEAFILNGTTMLPGGKTLTCEDIDILQRKYPDAPLRIGDPILDSICEFENDSRDREVALTVTQQVSNTMRDVQQKFSPHTNLGGVNFQALRRNISDIVDFLKGNPVSAALVMRSASSKSYLAEHSGNVFYLSMVLGSAVRDYVIRERMRQTSASTLTTALAMDLMPLGLGAMFLDVAMYPLEHIFEKDYHLTEADKKAIFEHPVAGADMLPDSIPPATKLVVRCHHENFDGTGYPHKRPGGSLHIFVRIARICDAFDAATSEKFYGKSKTPARTLWEMAYGPFRRCYDPVLMKVFTSIIQPFPIGAKLLLADGRTAVVVKYNRKNAFQPTVIIAFDEHGQRLTAEKIVPPVNVGDGNDLRLKSFAGEDLSYIHDSNIAEQTHDAATFHNLLEACYP